MRVLLMRTRARPTCPAATENCLAVVRVDGVASLVRQNAVGSRARSGKGARGGNGEYGGSSEH
jgi:hypothetical protein